MKTYRKGIKDKAFNKNVSVKTILQYIINSINPKIKLVCDYDMVYESFTIYQATGMDVLQKIQEDTRSDIYFKMTISNNLGKSIDEINVNEFDEGNLELHVRMPYIENKSLDINHCDYSMQHNIESSNLEYIETADKKVKVKIVTNSITGYVKQVEYGHADGEEFEYKINRISEPDMKKIAEQEFKKLIKPGYSGTFTGWLLPFVAPGYSIGIFDEDFPEKDGDYIVVGVNTTYSEAGGIRTITPGIKISKNK